MEFAIPRMLRRRARDEQPVDVIEAHSGLAGLFVGNGVVDADLIEALVDRSWATDEILLALAAGRREEAHGEYDSALQQFELAIGSAQATGAVELAAHARYDAARVRLARNRPGDPQRAWALLARAHEAAKARRMAELLSGIDALLSS